MRMGFVLFKYFPFGGIQRDLLKIARAAIARGHQVRIYAIRWEAPLPEEELEMKVERLRSRLEGRLARRVRIDQGLSGSGQVHRVQVGPLPSVEIADQVALEHVQEKTIQDAYAEMREKSPFELLGVATDASREEIERELRFHLCRCTGYDKIVRAVQAAAKEMRETA